MRHLSFVYLLLGVLILPPVTECRRHGGHHHRGGRGRGGREDDDDKGPRRYEPPEGTKGVLRKHAEVEVSYSEQLDPYFSLPCPDFCSCHLLKMYCDGQGLTHIPRHLPPEAEVLMLKDNNLKRVWQKHLVGLGAMKHLNLKNNKIQYVEPSAFIDLPKLNSLNLMENRLRALPPSTFRSQKVLQFLSLKNNRLRNIEGLFRKLPRLHLLNVGGNKVRKITENTFKHNPRLRVLDLHNNKIHYVNKYAFKALPLLKFLILRDNPLTQVDMDFKLNFHLELLDFTNCKLTRMVRGLPHSIRDLRLAENAITKLEDDDFKTTRKIRLLVLNQNRIESVSNGTFRRLWQLYDLYLSKNRIYNMPEKLPVTLHGLYVNHNHIKHIQTGVFVNNPNLEFLFLKANDINTVDANGFKGLQKLKSLDLSENGLGDLQPLAFSNMTKLQVLDLSANPLDRMEHNCFDGLRNLHILQMSSVASKHGTPPVIFKDMKRLLFLDLQNSSTLVRHLAENPYVLRFIRSVEDLNLIDDGLYGLPPSFPRHFPKLKTVKMVGNPWHCDITIYWLTLWMRRSKVNFFSPDEMLCASPPQLKGRKIKELREDELPRIPKRRKQRPDLTVIDLPFKHSLKKNVTLVFNVSVDEDSGDPSKGKLASVQLSKKKIPPLHSKEVSKRKKKKSKKSKKSHRPDNDVILGDSGAVYSSGNVDSTLQDSLKSELKTEVKDTGTQLKDTKKNSEDIDGSGNIVVSGALARRALAESSGETEPFLT